MMCCELQIAVNQEIMFWRLVILDQFRNTGRNLAKGFDILV